MPPLQKGWGNISRPSVSNNSQVSGILARGAFLLLASRCAKALRSGAGVPGVRVLALPMETISSSLQKLPPGRSLSTRASFPTKASRPPLAMAFAMTAFRMALRAFCAAIEPPLMVDPVRFNADFGPGDPGSPSSEFTLPLESDRFIFGDRRSPTVDSERFIKDFFSGGAPACSGKLTNTTVMSSLVSLSSFHKSCAAMARPWATPVGFFLRPSFKLSATSCAVMCSHTPSLQITSNWSEAEIFSCMTSGSEHTPMSLPHKSPTDLDMFNIGPLPPFLWTRKVLPSKVIDPPALVIRLDSDGRFGLWSGVKYFPLKLVPCTIEQPLSPTCATVKVALLWSCTATVAVVPDFSAGILPILFASSTCLVILAKASVTTIFVSTMPNRRSSKIILGKAPLT
mmetsp:Transcript_29793/g.86444  ORF Transcript_29793/g.86444 Transcript_29793/m.86444 type:complete len:398 (-) Transcript_29793:709-1902(-)